MRTYGQIKSVIHGKGWKWNSEKYKLNIVWERTNDIFTNKFTDFMYLAYLDDKGVELVEVIPATTKPGLKGSVLEPTTVRGVKGTAVIEFPQQVIDGWKFIDSYKNFSKYPFFRQVANVKYWRDGDKDKDLDKVDEETAINGTHGHRMSNNDTYGSGEVNNWSLGCMGSPEPEWKKILLSVRRHVKLHGDLFTWTMLETNDLNIIV